MFAIAPLFWTLPTAFLSGTAAAGGIALINSIGNLAGFAAPYAMGYLKDATGGFTAGLLVVAFFPFLSAIRELPQPYRKRMIKMVFCPMTCRWRKFFP
jgi:MFS transporter, ACS family, tartrate transporter